MSDERAAQLAGPLAMITGARRVSVDSRATGGLSQETWFVTVDGKPAVLRLPTPASGARSIATQRIALSAAHAAGLPVPELFAADDGAANPLQQPYLLMQRAIGEIPRSWNELAPERRVRLGVDAMHVLAALQRIEPDLATGLRAPATDPAAEELAFYRRRFGEIGVSRSGTVEVAFRWLEANLPASTEPVIVHNDFRMGNLVVGPESITAVLDWELAAIGHPLADLTWCFIAVWEVPEIDIAEMYLEYERAAGVVVDPVAAQWYTAMGYLRLLWYGLSGGSAFAAGQLHDLRQPALRLQTGVRIERLLSVIDGEPPR